MVGVYCDSCEMSRAVDDSPLLNSCLRQAKYKLTSDAFRTDDIDVFSVSHNDFTDDGQAKACSFFILTSGAVCFVETTPDFFDAVSGDTHAEILDGDKHLAMFFAGLYQNRGAVVGELDGVIQ